MEAVIRTQRPDERGAVADLVARSFQDQVVGDLVVALQEAPAGAAGLWYVAEAAGELVGMVMLTRSWVDAPARLIEVLVLSPLAVLPEYHGKGLGGRLVGHALTEAEQTGAALVFLEGDPAYYSRFGFRPAGPLGFTKPSVRIPDAAFQVVILPGYESWMRGALVYAEQFWAFDTVGQRD